MTDDPRMCPRDGRPCFCLEECDDDALLVRELVLASRRVAKDEANSGTAEKCTRFLRASMSDPASLKRMVEAYRALSADQEKYWERCLERLVTGCCS